MVGFVYLETALDTLDETKNHSEYQNQNRHPECIPLHAVAAIVPPLGKSSWGGVVISVFQDHKTIPPEFELFNLTRFGVKVTTLS